MTGLLIKLSVYGDYYQTKNSQYCSPINFYWGNDIPCRKVIKDIVNKSIRNEDFVTLNTVDNKQIIDSEKVVSNIDYNDFKKTIVDNYLAIIDLIHSFNEFILLVLLKIGGNVINNIFN